MVSDRLDSRLATLLKKVRVEKRVSVRYLAELANLTPSTIYRIEANEQQPSLLVVTQICKALDIESAALFTALEKEEEEVFLSTDYKPSEKIRSYALDKPQQVDALLELLNRLLDGKD